MSRHWIIRHLWHTWTMHQSKTWFYQTMMTSSNGNIFRATGHLCGEFTGNRWIPRTKAIDAEFWCFSLICSWTNGWVNNREAGDLRRHRAHCDVIVMWSASSAHQKMESFALCNFPLRLKNFYNMCAEQGKTVGKPNVSMIIAYNTRFYVYISPYKLKRVCCTFFPFCLYRTLLGDSYGILTHIHLDYPAGIGIIVSVK